MEVARALVVDDDPDCRRVLGHILAELGFTEVAHAGNVAGALRECFGRPFDLVFLDIAMPGVGGEVMLDILDQARGLPDAPTPPPVVVTTAVESSRQLIELARHESVYTVVRKPINAPAIEALWQGFKLLRAHTPNLGMSAQS